MALRPARPIALFAVMAILAALGWCIQFTARAAPSSPPRTPHVLSPLSAFEDDPPVVDARAWRLRRAPILQHAFLSRIYGPLPTQTPTAFTRTTIDTAALGGSARLELITAQFGTQGARIPLDAALYVPSGSGPFPVIVVTDYCGLDADIDPRLPAPAWRPSRCRSTFGRALTRLLHGDAILTPPIQAMVSRGYAVAVFFPGEVAPDDPVRFQQAVTDRIAGAADSGAIAVWAWLYLRVFEAVQTDPRLDSARVAFWGHSRYGKAALLAGALDGRIAAIIANQSGTFGATLSYATRGESIAQIVHRFPHWFRKSLVPPSGAPSSDELDQHQLLALLAPRPLLLGNAKLDRWSDPAAAFASARAASDAYKLYRRQGLAQHNLRAPDLTADIAFYERSGGHGVRSSDWTVALDFLDRHFKSADTAARSGRRDAEPQLLQSSVCANRSVIACAH